MNFEWKYSIYNSDTGKIESGKLTSPFKASVVCKDFENNGCEVLYLSKVIPLWSYILHPFRNLLEKEKQCYGCA